MTISFQGSAPALQSASYIVPLHQAVFLDLVGGKAHNLYRVLELGLRVPCGFVVTTRAFEAHLEENDLAVRIHALSQRKTRQLSSQSGLVRDQQLSARIH